MRQDSSGNNSVNEHFGGKKVKRCHTIINFHSRECPKLAALDLSQNSLYALEYDVIAPIISKLRAIYLNGNHFNCHCSLRWLAELLTASDSPVQDPDGLQCSNNGQNKVNKNGNY